MSIHDNDTARSLHNRMKDFQRDNGLLPGIANPTHLKNLILQFIDSIHREKFAFHIRDARLHPARMDPGSEIFDPLRAAVLRNRRGEYDEAWWLVFLATHFGKHPVDGWRLTRDVYGKLGQGGTWSWTNISNDPLAFQKWLAANQSILQGADGISRRFNNHRKYESLDAISNNGTASVFASYVKWIAPPRSHPDLIHEQHRLVGQDPKAVFAALYKSMNGVRRFGRLGKFDFLAMLGKLGIAPVEPGSTFLKGATGPLAGARLLFSGSRETKISPADLEEKLGVLSERVGLSPQVLEDALCNWQKHPDKYKRFRG